MVKKLVRPAVLRKKHASQRIFLAGHNWGTTRKWRHPPETTESRWLSGLTFCLRNQRSGVQVAPGAPSLLESMKTLARKCCLALVRKTRGGAFKSPQAGLCSEKGITYEPFDRPLGKLCPT